MFKRCQKCNGVGAISVTKRDKEGHPATTAEVCPDCKGLGRIEEENLAPRQRSSVATA